MDETGQPGAATPGENDNGAGRDDLARSGSEWAPAGSGWSPSAGDVDAEPLPPPWRRPPSDPAPRPAWADAGNPFRPVPVPHPDDLRRLEQRKPRNGSSRPEYHESAHPVPLGAPSSGPPYPAPASAPPFAASASGPPYPASAGESPYGPELDPHEPGSHGEDAGHGYESDPRYRDERGGPESDRLAVPLLRPVSSTDAAGSPPSTMPEATEIARHARDEPSGPPAGPPRGPDGPPSPPPAPPLAERARPETVGHGAEPGRPTTGSGRGVGHDRLPPERSGATEDGHLDPGHAPSDERAARYAGGPHGGPPDAVRLDEPDARAERERTRDGVEASAIGPTGDGDDADPAFDRTGVTDQDSEPVFSPDELDELMPRHRGLAGRDSFSWRDVTPSTERPGRSGWPERPGENGSAALPPHEDGGDRPSAWAPARPTGRRAAPEGWSGSWADRISPAPEGPDSRRALTPRPTPVDRPLRADGPAPVEPATVERRSAAAPPAPERRAEPPAREGRPDPSAATGRRERVGWPRESEPAPTDTYRPGAGTYRSGEPGHRSAPPGQRSYPPAPTGAETGRTYPERASRSAAPSGAGEVDGPAGAGTSSWPGFTPPGGPPGAAGWGNDPTGPDGGQQPEPGGEALPQRVPAEPDVPVVPEPPVPEPPAETPELARIATHLRRGDDRGQPRERPDGFDVDAILEAVHGVAGVREALLRTTEAGAHSLRLELADGADPAEVSRQVARLLQDRMGLAAAPSDPGDAESGAPAGPYIPCQPRSEGRRAGGPAAPPAIREAEPEAPRRRRQAATRPGRAQVVDPATPPAVRPGPLVPSGGPPIGTVGATHLPAGTSYAGGAQVVGTETGVSRPLDTGGQTGPRAVIDHVQVSTFGLEATVEVKLAAGERRATGVTTGPAVDGYLLRLCAGSAAAAIDELLSSSRRVGDRGRCFVEHAAVVPFGNCEVATVVVLLVCGGWVEQLAGSAIVSGGDPRQAIVRATLAAVNRRLEALLA